MSLLNTTFEDLLGAFSRLDFAKFTGKPQGSYIKTVEYNIICVENILMVARNKNYAFGTHNSLPYFYDGSYWQIVNKALLLDFLGRAALAMGVPIFTAKHYDFREEMYKQMLSAAYLTSKEKGKLTQINLANGTYEISLDVQTLKKFDPADFLKYKLPFEFDPEAKAPLFHSYLDTALPDKQAQKVLAEYLGYVFIKPSVLKLEKALLILGPGGNGKSVFFDIVNALLGSENTCQYSLNKITTSEYTRVNLGEKLLNYATEIDGRLDPAVLKQLISNEPVEARRPRGEPFILTDYAKLIFNCNDLPKDVEHTEAFFRRLIIMPFNATIEESNKDVNLAEKIVKNELSGILNWAIEGLKRLIVQQKFSKCDLAANVIEQYRSDSNSVKLFLDEFNYQPSPSSKVALSGLYTDYSWFCKNSGFRPLNIIHFRQRLEYMKVEVRRFNQGNFVFLESAPIEQPIVVKPAKQQPHNWPDPAPDECTSMEGLYQYINKVDIPNSNITI